MLRRLAQLTVRRASNIPSRKSAPNTGVFMWHVDRLCRQNGQQTQSGDVANDKNNIVNKNGNKRVKTLAQLAISARPSQLALPAPSAHSRWFEDTAKWRPYSDTQQHHFSHKVKSQGFEIPAWILAIVKHKFVILAAKVVICAAVAYVLIVSFFAIIIVYIISVLERMKR